MGCLPEPAVCGDGPVPCDPVRAVRKYWRIRSVADVNRYCDQLCLLLSGGALGQEKADGRDADDAEDRGVCLDDLHGAWIDRAIANLKTLYSYWKSAKIKTQLAIEDGHCLTKGNAGKSKES